MTCKAPREACPGTCCELGAGPGWGCRSSGSQPCVSTPRRAPFSPALMGGITEAASTQATSTMPAPRHLAAASKRGGPQPPIAAGHWHRREPPSSPPRVWSPLTENTGPGVMDACFAGVRKLIICDKRKPAGPTCSPDPCGYVFIVSAIPSHHHNQGRPGSIFTTNSQDSPPPLI